MPRPRRTLRPLVWGMLVLGALPGAARAEQEFYQVEPARNWVRLDGAAGKPCSDVGDPATGLACTNFECTP